MSTGSYNPIIEKDYVYLRLKGLIWSDYGLEYPENLRSLTGGKVASLMRAFGNKSKVIINCSGVNSVDQHALEEVKKALLDISQPLVFLSDNRTFLGDVSHAMGEPKETIKSGTETNAHIYSRHPVKLGAITSCIAQSLKRELSRTKEIVTTSFEKNTANRMLRMHSTPLLSNGIFNARPLIGDPKKFAFITLLLAEKLESLLQKHHPENPRILAVSLRGSPIAAAVAFLSCPRLDCEIIDHMGPKQMLLEGHPVKDNVERVNYIYIGDFLVGGTELKVASSYAGALGSRISHALVIGSLLNINDYSLPMPTEALICLKDCKVGSKYQFK